MSLLMCKLRRKVYGLEMPLSNSTCFILMSNIYFVWFRCQRYKLIFYFALATQTNSNETQTKINEIRTNLHEMRTNLNAIRTNLNAMRTNLHAMQTKLNATQTNGNETQTSAFLILFWGFASKKEIVFS